MSRVVVTPILLLYSPIGLVLVLIRSLLLIYVFLASVILYTVPPIKRLMLRTMCSILGFIVTTEGTPCCSLEQPLVSNCVTLFDHMALNLLTNCVTPYKFMLSWALTWRHLSYDESDCETKINDVFHLQPEETPIGPNSKVVLQFNRAPFRLFRKVQPVVISVTQYLPIHLSVHPIDWKYEIFWLLFNPAVRVHVRFLAPISISSSAPNDNNKGSNNCFTNNSNVEERKNDTVSNDSKDDENIDRFVETVRTAIAEGLGAKLVNMNSNRFALLMNDARELINSSDSIRTEKSQRQEKNETEIRCNQSAECDPRVGQILAVLPNVNPAVVKSILEHIFDVDAAIAYLIEHDDSSGPAVTNQSGQAPQSQSSAPSSSMESSSKSMDNMQSRHVAPSCLKVAASSFSRNPQERHKSFTDRKVAFYENARQRYLELHQY